jgi:hypothetical protein
MWASETDLEGLQYWYTRFANPTGDPKWADRDKERARKLQYWVQYREADPYSRWKGVRGNGECVANQPTNKPTIFPWDGPVSTPSPLPNQDPGDAWEPTKGDDDPIPF